MMYDDGVVRRPESGFAHVIMIVVVVVAVVLVFYLASDASRPSTSHRASAPSPVSAPTSRPNTGTEHVGPTAALDVTVEATPSATGTVVVVATVRPGGPAAAAGIVPGAVIASIDDVTIASARDLDAALSPHRPGDVVRVGWADRNGVFHTSDIRLVSGPPA